MTTLIIITAYIANVFLCRRLTRLSVKNQGKYMTVTFDYPVVWFIPILGNIWCSLDYFSSLSDKDCKRSRFFGKNW